MACILLVISSFIFVMISADPVRELHFFRNPQCPATLNCDHSNSSAINNLYYVQSISGNETIHFLWSTIGLPTLLTVKAASTAKLVINWNDLLSDDVVFSVKFTEEPIFSSALVITKLWEFNDTHDEADLTSVPESAVTAKSLANMSWAMPNAASDVLNSTSFVGVNLTSYDPILGSNAAINLGLAASSVDFKSPLLPHFVQNEYNFVVNLYLRNLTTATKSSRFGIELFAIQARYKNNDDGLFYFAPRRSVDDENTPGIFETVDLLDGSPHTNASLYMQWKPICYTTNKKVTADSTRVTHYALKNISHPDRFNGMRRSLAYAFYGNTTEKLRVMAFNLTFGEPDDRFYRNTNFHTWSFLMGIGRPHQDPDLALIIGLVVMGLFATMILGILTIFLVILIKNRRGAKDELLLGRD